MTVLILGIVAVMLTLLAIAIGLFGDVVALEIEEEVEQEVEDPPADPYDTGGEAASAADEFLEAAGDFYDGFIDYFFPDETEESDDEYGETEVDEYGEPVDPYGETEVDEYGNPIDDPYGETEVDEYGEPVG